MNVVCAGLLTMDVVQTVDRLPRSNEKLVASSARGGYGGPAANAAGVAAGLGLNATLMSECGQSALADAVRRELRATGVTLVDVAPDRDDALPISTILVEAPNGNRAVVSVNASLSSQALAPIGRWPVSTRACLVDGHNMALCLHTAERARARGIPVVFDGGSWKEGTERLLPLVDLAVVSADFRAPDNTDSLEYLIRSGCRYVAQSAGGEDFRAIVDERVVTIAVPSIAVQDTLGAGDVLHGAMVAAIARIGLSDATVEDVLAYGVRVASISCLRPGARGWLEDVSLRTDAMALLNSLGHHGDNKLAR